MFLHRVEDGASGHLGDAQGPGHGRRNQRRVGHRGQVDEKGAVPELLQHLGGDLKGQPGLAGAPGSGEGEEPWPGEEPLDLGDLLLAADERGELRGEVVRPGVHGAGRWEVGREALDHELVEALGVDDVLEPMLPEVPE